MIRVRGVSKRFGARVAVDNLSFVVNKGEILGFLGPNGAGKTTTMRMIVGCLIPTAGEIFVNNVSVEKEPLITRSIIGYLPENPPLYNELTVLEYLSFVLRLSGVFPKEFKSRIDNVYQMCGLGDVGGRLIGNLSKGYRQRVGLAQALIHNPRILILDEPTVGLDPKQIHEIRELIRGFAKDHTIVLSSHILPEVSKTCDRVIIISEGRIVASDTCDALSSKYLGGNRFEITMARPCSDVIGRLQALDGVLSVIPAEAGSQTLVIPSDEVTSGISSDFEEIPTPSSTAGDDDNAGDPHAASRLGMTKTSSRLGMTKTSSRLGMTKTSHPGGSRDPGRRFIVEGRRGAEIREALANMVVREDWGLLGLKALEFSLEDVYLKLTMEECEE